MMRDARRCSRHLRAGKFKGKKSALFARPIHTGTASSYRLKNADWLPPRYAVRNGVQAQHYLHIAAFDLRVLEGALISGGGVSCPDRRAFAWRLPRLPLHRRSRFSLPKPTRDSPSDT